ncbi:MAG: hypothetical protein A3D96_00630 [Chlamydiae bacterium RIFCSPHIGHO2_12_FULL_44_59]|nr:MAG: hypothetical protein A2796_00075 [Chlamydiae bacterium RIFCSPHIGHO2_01_FULL_44_39]OGN57593.1 MAG: hypothetical protein A3C42_02880 [Chlamydiae bacterium RIFCSPHIGHO2_02_FULL_45_9]OGN59952.1 MAG: hypothetical protein A3D96_00630 [Chlamydiae bacterium RIFCSPHIGHO2_12_FULL_44_59]OGN66167.1 MAG: hypothetical protein A2978_05955 [Chlamydiae bacterium RIFCSPLOWO2_01_FULL_44_52]OGN69071.1 MAG: hypothetical protein A3I67_07440 [Chlamydiae bacterium RIFCSPLOWO2_02_FULL_45_22]OGN69906.1 MAG: hyp
MTLEYFMQKTSIIFSLVGSFLFAAENDLLKGALILNDAAKVKEEHIDLIEGVQFDGIRPSEELAAILEDFPLTQNGAEGLREAIASYYADHEYRFSVIVPPNQDTSNGVVQLVVAPERLGTLNVKDNEFTDSRALTKWVRLKENDAIHKQTLAEDIGWLNSNPFRSITVNYESGGTPGVTDVDLIVTDKKSWKISTGVDNNGTLPVGTTRIFGTIDVNDFIFSDHTLKLETTLADHIAEYQSYAATYIAPLPWRNTLKLSGSWSGTTPKSADFPQKNRQNYKAGIRYAIPQWFVENSWIDQLTWETGFDFKGADSNLIYEDDPAPVDKKLAYISQFTGSVNAARKSQTNTITAGIDLIGSPMSLLPHQTDADFGNLREGATVSYVYSKLALAVDQSLYDWKFSAKGRAQVSPSTLLPSEQFSLGGHSTVRGYQEKVVGGDNSFCGNFEISTPTIASVGIWVPKFDDHFTILGFVDAGYAWFNDSVADRPKQESLLGIGSGVRYAVASYFTSSLDVGFPLKKVQKDDSGKPRVHFSAALSY